MTKNLDSTKKNMLILACVISMAIGAAASYFFAKEPVTTKTFLLSCPPGCVSANIFGSPRCYNLAAAQQGRLEECN